MKLYVVQADHLTLPTLPTLNSEATKTGKVAIQLHQFVHRT